MSLLCLHDDDGDEEDVEEEDDDEEDDHEEDVEEEDVQEEDDDEDDERDKNIMKIRDTLLHFCRSLFFKRRFL